MTIDVGALYHHEMNIHLSIKVVDYNNWFVSQEELPHHWTRLSRIGGQERGEFNYAVYHLHIIPSRKSVLKNDLWNTSGNISRDIFLKIVTLGSGCLVHYHLSHRSILCKSWREEVDGATDCRDSQWFAILSIFASVSYFYGLVFWREVLFRARIAITSECCNPVT